ncbi:MAG: phosphatidylserine/phosphatidylglycerophosphate/cardiolipin synthase family protein [Candidatus Muiribacteriota bacterium]
MKKQLFIALILIICASATYSSEYYTNPFSLPSFLSFGAYNRYYRDTIEPRLLEVDFYNYQPCAVRVFQDSDEVYTRALELLDSAKTSIMFNMYLFGGTIGERVINVLEKKREQGVKIYMVLPKTKSRSEQNGNYYEYYGFYDEEFEPRMTRDSSVKPPYKQKISEVLKRNFPVVHTETSFLKGVRPVKVDHNKIILVDGVRAMVGGMNFADTVAKNRDSLVEVVGPFVKEIEKIFINNWILGYANEYTNLEQYNGIIAEREMRNVMRSGEFVEAKAFPTVTAPYAYNTLEPLLKMIDNAQKSIYIAQLLFNEETLIKAVSKAALRGVDVKILVDPATHLYSFDWKGGPNNKLLGTFQELKKAENAFNGEVRHFDIDPGQELHLKLIIVDGEFVATGSTNFATNAFDANYEAFFFFKSAGLASIYESRFLWDWNNKSVVPDDLGLIEKITGLLSGIVF